MTLKYLELPYCAVIDTTTMQVLDVLDRKQLLPKRYERCSSCSWTCCYQIFNSLKLCQYATVVIKLRPGICDHIPHQRPVSDFYVKS